MLDRKLAREIYGSKGLLLAITSIIAVGVMCFVSMRSAYHNLNQAKTRYYRQCRMAELSQRVQDTVVILVTALYAHQQRNEVTTDAADIICQDLRRKLTGERPSDRYFKDVSQAADKVIGGGFEVLAGAPIGEILMRY